MAGQPLLEVFGFPVSNTSDEAQRHRRDRLCPFGNRVPSCTKSSVTSPLGVCSITHGDGLAVICPIRLRERELITSHAREFFFPDAEHFTAIKEVRLYDAHGRSAGSIDHVVIALDEEGQILDFGALEVQTVYISGTLRERFFKPYMDDPQEYRERDWAKSKKQPPRPDYLSSSRKRLAPQLIFKGGILKAWGRKMAIAVDKSVFETLPALEEVEKTKADVAWFVYDLVLDPVQSRYQLQLHKSVYTGYDPVLHDLYRPAISGDGETLFLQHLERRLDTAAVDSDTK